MFISVPKSLAPKLARCLMNNEMIEVFGTKVGTTKVFYDVDVPDFFEFPDWVKVEA